RIASVAHRHGVDFNELRGRWPVIARILKKQVAGFGDRYGYDVSYLHDLVDTDRTGAVKMLLVGPFTRHRFGLPAAPYFAAKIIATRRADCGACLKLAIDMAAEAGVPLAAIRQLLLGSGEEAPPEMQLAARYAHAALDNDPALPAAIEACTRRWGKRGLAGLAAAVTARQLYPVFKRGLGHTTSCTPVMAWLRSPDEGRLDS
ncbi:MAG: hypothetical protein OXP69_02090, partial [Spirochaetaceae bacterium]|nr:hypothetical protein [Spirochaetaceae bacterium]